MSSKIKLYKHQQDALDSIKPALSAPGTRATVNMACGTGKTLVSIKATEALMANTPGAKVIVFVPSLALHDQLMTNWVKFNAFKGAFTMLPVASSGASVGKTHNSFKPIILPSTTDVPEIINALKTKGRVVVFCTYQSAGSIQTAMSKMPEFAFDLAIMDEAHRTAGHKSGLGSSYLKCLHDTNIPISRRLFMTATPRVINPVEESQSDPDDPTESFIEHGVSMSDESLYGKVVHTYSFSEAVIDKKLADFRIWAIMISDKDIQKAALADSRIDLTGVNLKSKDEDDLRKIYSAKHLAVAAVVDRMAKQNIVNGAIAFHQERVKSMMFTENAKRFFQLSNSKKFANAFVAHIDGNTPQTARQNVMIGFDKAYKANHFSMISNVAVLTEGVDVPELDTVIFVDNKTSEISIVQAVGRAVRLNSAEPDKIANVIIPIFCGDSDNPEEKTESSEFSTLYRIVAALRESDNMTAYYSKAVRRNALESEGVAELDEVARVVDSDEVAEFDEVISVVDSEGTFISGSENSSITFVMPESEGTVDKMSTVVVASYRQFASSCEAKIIGSYPSTFERNVGNIEAFKRLPRNANLEARFSIGPNERVGKYALGREMEKVKNAFNAGRLPENERKVYESLGLDFASAEEKKSDFTALLAAMSS